MSNANAITTELLDALLSADADRRRQAESYLRQLSVQDRAAGLLKYLALSCQPNGSGNHHHFQLAAVLLRRDVLKLTDASALKGAIDALARVFFSDDSIGIPHRGRSLVADCLAEACGALQVFSASEADCQAVVQGILQMAGTPASRGDPCSLGLLVRLADRAPRAFCGCPAAIESLPQLVRSALQSSANRGPLLNVLTELVVAAAAAVAATTARNDPKQSEAVVGQLGTVCLMPLVQSLQQWVSSSSMADNKEEEELLKVLEHWVHAAETVTALVATDPAVLEAVAQTCLGLVQQAKAGRGVAPALRALDVLAAASADRDARNRILSSETLRNSFLPSAVTFLLQAMAEAAADAVEEWSADPVSLEDAGCDPWEDDGEALQQAEELLQSVLSEYSDKALETALPAVERLLGTASLDVDRWKEHRAGLAALQCCAEAAPVAFARHVPIAVEAALAFAKSPNARVQFQAVRLLGLLCEGGAGGPEAARAVREGYGAAILTAMALAAQQPCTKVSAVACSALVSYCRPSDEDDQDTSDGRRFVVPFLSDLMAALLNGPLARRPGDAAGVAAVQVRAVGAVACLAAASGASAFAPFYSALMPGLLSLATDDAATSGVSSGHCRSQLRGAALEAASIVGQAVVADDEGEGEQASARDAFVADAHRIMQWVVRVLTSSFSDAGHGDAVGGLPTEQLLSCCARIATVLRSEYAPYVEVVLPHLLKEATDSTDFEVTEGDEAGLEATLRGDSPTLTNGTEGGDWMQSVTVALPGRGLTRVTVNTSRVQAKAQAIRAVYEHAAAMGAGFGPYAERCMQTLLPMVDFRFSSEIRATAAQTLSAVFEAACGYAEEAGGGSQEVPKIYLPMLARAISQQFQHEDTAEMEVLYALADSLSDTFLSVYRRMGPDRAETPLLEKLNLTEARAVVEECMKAMVACLERRGGTATVLATDRTLSGDERENNEALLRAEEMLLTPLVDTVGYILKFFREEFLPVFEGLVVPVLGPLLTQGDDIRGRLSAVCLYDDCIEYCGTAAAGRFGPHLALGVLLGLDENKNGDDEDLVRASIYGVAQLARYAPSAVLEPYIENLLPRLVAMASTPKDRSENLAILENAVSALASLVLIGSAPFCSAGYVKRDVAMRIFLENLPLREDEDEAKICLSGLCDLVEHKSFDLAAAAPELLRIVGETLARVEDGEDLVSAETSVRLSGMLYRLQKEGRPDSMHQCFTGLSPEEQAAINRATAKHAFAHSKVVTP